MDVIALSAFGMSIDSLGEDDDPFTVKAKRVFGPPANKSPLLLIPCETLFSWNTLTILMKLFFYSTVVIPSLRTMFGERVFQAEPFQFFIRVVDDLVKQRANSVEVGLNWWTIKDVSITTNIDQFSVYFDRNITILSKWPPRPSQSARKKSTAIKFKCGVRKKWIKLSWRK